MRMKLLQEIFSIILRSAISGQKVVLLASDRKIEMREMLEDNELIDISSTSDIMEKVMVWSNNYSNPR